MTVLRSLALIGLTSGGLLLAADEAGRNQVRITKTESVDFPPGGVLRLHNSVGTLTIEAWDKPEVEITTIKTTDSTYAPDEREKGVHYLDRVRVTTERKGDELVITTDFPRYRPFPPPSPIGTHAKFELEYRIKAPANARLVVAHDSGEVNVDGLTGDMHINLLQGEIFLHLPEEGQYAIRARSDLGHVASDFAGQTKRTRWIAGHRLTSKPSQAAASKLNLSVGFGDIVILKIRVPKAPSAANGRLP